jgi:hypothetical protein
MKLKHIAGYTIIIACCLLATGCFSIEQEIFLNADGSGQLVIFISLPDLPEKMGSAEVTKKSPADALGEFKKELTAVLPPTVTLKQFREVKQNGVQSIYLVFAFKQVQDIQQLLANFGKSTLKEGEIGSDPQWSLQVDKRDNKSSFIQKFLLDVDAKAKAEVKSEVKVNGKVQEQPKNPEEDKSSKEMDEQLKPLILSIVRMRFVLHTPSPITDSNADIVLNGNTAIWNCSLAAFSKEKKPIEMKASF